MEDFERDADEDILLRAGNIRVKSRSLEACLTTKNIVLIDSTSASFRRIPLDALTGAEKSENAIRDPCLVFSVLTTASGPRQIRLTFPRTTSGSRARERDAWFQQIQALLAPQPARNLPGETTATVKPPAPSPGGQLGTYCTRCGLRVSETATFCERCGSRIIRAEIHPEPAPMPTPAVAESVPEELPFSVGKAPTAPSSQETNPEPPEHKSPDGKPPKNRKKLFIVLGIVIILIVVFVFVVMPKTGTLSNLIPGLGNGSVNATANVTVKAAKTIHP